MRQVLPDLWETATDHPFPPGLTTHAYLWTSDRNALFYSVASAAEFDDLEKLGGVDDQYLSHQDEAGPVLRRIEDRFGATLHAPAPPRSTGSAGTRASTSRSPNGTSTTTVSR